MRNRFLRPIFTVIFVAVVLLYSAPVQATDTAKPAIPTGLIELPGYNHPVYIFVPEGYTPDNAYPLIISIPKGGEDPVSNIDYWVSLARRKSLLVVTPASFLRPGSEPYRMDDWVLKIKQDIAERYRVAKDQTYLVGVGQESAHYAAYLGVNFPDQFAAVALLGGSWDGYLEKMMILKNNPGEQLPFLLAFEKRQGNSMEQAKKAAYRLEDKGYPIHFMDPESDEGFKASAFKIRLLTQLQEVSQSWDKIVQANEKTWRQRVRKWWKRNLTVN